MFRQSGEAQDLTSDEVKLADLKKRLLTAIDAYIRKSEKTVKVSFRNPESYRLHLSRGEEGVARAERYKKFITEHENYNELIEKLYSDIKDSVKVQEGNTITCKATKLFESGYDYARAKISGYIYPGSAASEPEPEVDQTPTLGTSEILTLEFARVLCQHFDLNPRNESLLKELTEVNPEAAKGYDACELKRIITAIDKFMETKAASLESSVPAANIQ